MSADNEATGDGQVARETEAAEPLRERIALAADVTVYLERDRWSATGGWTARVPPGAGSYQGDRDRCSVRGATAEVALLNLASALRTSARERITTARRTIADAQGEIARNEDIASELAECVRAWRGGSRT